MFFLIGICFSFVLSLPKKKYITVFKFQMWVICVVKLTWGGKKQKKKIYEASTISLRKENQSLITNNKL